MRVEFELQGSNLDMVAGICALRLHFDPSGCDSCLEVGIWAFRLRFGLLGQNLGFEVWDLGLEARILALRGGT